MTTSEKALQLIMHFESLHDGDKKKDLAQPMMDPIGIWTVGYGHALRGKDGKFLKGEDSKSEAYKQFPALTVDQAKELLAQDLKLKFEPAVKGLIKRTDLSDDQFGALVSFCYNCGTSYDGKDGKPHPYAIWENINNRMGDGDLRAYWNTSVIKSGGQVLKGLQIRRMAEAELYLTGNLKWDFKV